MNCYFIILLGTLAKEGGQGVENPKSLDDRGLYDYIVKHEFYALLAKPLEYDTINQVLYIELTSRCMIELIFNTFQTLGSDLSCCLFGGLPNLQQVTIVYSINDNGWIAEKGDYIEGKLKVFGTFFP